VCQNLAAVQARRIDARRFRAAVIGSRARRLFLYAAMIT
jgi:hypothetical protein